MATVNLKAKLDVQVQFVVNEVEARALVDLGGYGVDQFIKAFYELLGRAYMEKHEDGLRSFLHSVNDFMPQILYRIDAAKKAFNGNK